MDIPYGQLYKMNKEEARKQIEKLKESGYDLPEEFAVFPPIILDTISTDWLLETGNDILVYYPG